VNYRHREKKRGGGRAEGGEDRGGEEKRGENRGEETPLLLEFGFWL
jgi:hypothetical protein